MNGLILMSIIMSAKADFTSMTKQLKNFYLNYLICIVGSSNNLDSAAPACYKKLFQVATRTVAARGNPVEVRGEPIAVKSAGFFSRAFR